MKRGKRELLLDIKETLTEPANTQEVANAIEANWSTAQDNLSLLQDLGIVDKDEDEWYLADVQQQPADHMGRIPLDQAAKHRIKAFAGKVKQAWMNTHGDAPGSTQLQKAMVAARDALNYEALPKAWYLYGAVIPYNISAANVDCQDPSEEIHDSIAALPSNEEELLRQQYEDKADYQLKETIRTNLKQQDRTQYTGVDFANDLFQIQLESEAHGDNAEELEELASDLVAALGDARRDHDVSNEAVLTVFESYWRAYAFNEFKRTLEGDIGCPVALAKPALQNGYEAMVGACTDEITTL